MELSSEYHLLFLTVTPQKDRSDTPQAVGANQHSPFLMKCLYAHTAEEYKRIAVLASRTNML